MLNFTPDPALPAPPGHVAIIMDGNGRWATGRGLPRIAGHREGAERVREIVEASGDFGVRHLTLFAFSTENWRRSVEEVQGLMGLFRLYMRKEADELERRGARVRFIGDRERLDADLQRQMRALEERTDGNTAIELIIALNYGGRSEIARAARLLAEKVRRGEIEPEEIDEDAVAGSLYTDGTPDPDMVIRTSGEMRVSNFLSWQCAYSEFVFVEETWPDFTREVYARALGLFGARNRRYGAAPA